ncbi:hypothetical protein [Solemya velesiana gill symbiont]|nr:hypothetical protein [Solemya velesiana gill symbiont]
MVKSQSGESLDGEETRILSPHEDRFVAETQFIAYQAEASCSEPEPGAFDPDKTQRLIKSQSTQPQVLPPRPTPIRPPFWERLMTGPTLWVLFSIFCFSLGTQL